MVTGPVFTAAAMSAVLRRPLAYVITAKSQLKSADLLSTFRLHLWWAAVTAAILGYGVWAGRGPLSIRLVLALMVATCLAPPLTSWASGLRDRRGDLPG